MKKLIILIAILSVGCSTINEIPSVTNVYAFDFTEYSDKGFYFYERCYNGDYVLLANVVVEYYPEGHKVESTESRKDDLYGEITPPGSWKFEPVDYQMMLSLIHEEALKFDANAIMNFNYDQIAGSVSGVNVMGVKVSGSAIKIQE